MALLGNIFKFFSYKNTLEKENQLMKLLMRETSHRSKNNLQIILSLITLNSLSCRTSSCNKSLNELKNRVECMAHIEELLFKSEANQEFDCEVFFQSLIDNLLQSFDHLLEVRFVMNCSLKSHNVNVMIYIGLVLNELITNSYKYAYPNQNNGLVQVYLGDSTTKNMIELRVSDFGKGLPNDFQKRTEIGLGLSLVHDLTHKLHGNIDINSDKGTHVKILFPIPVT